MDGGSGGVPRYEAKFELAVGQLLERWLTSERLSTRPSNAYEFAVMLRSLAHDFLRIEQDEIEALFMARYEQQLISYFVENYEEGRLREFVLLLCHLVLSHNWRLFGSRISLSGRYFGRWAVVLLKPSPVMNAIEERLMHPLHSESFTVHYDRRFRGERPPRELPVEEGLRSIVVGTVAVVLAGLGGLVGRRWSELWSMWLPSDSRHQAMATFGYAPGSLQLYGLCLEYEKGAPHGEYRPLATTLPPAHLVPILARLPQFQSLLADFMDSRDPELIRIAQDHPELVWKMLQYFLWLTTQAAPKAQASVIAATSADPDHHYVVRNLLELVAKTPSTIHPDNGEIGAAVREGRQ